MARSLSTTVGIVDTTRGGSALVKAAAGKAGYWDTSPGGGANHTAGALRTMMDADLARPAFVIWSQGERDANSSLVSGWQYAEALHRVRAVLTRGWINVPFLIVELVPPIDARGDWGAIQAGQQLAATSSPNTHLVSIPETKVRHLGDSVHYDDPTLARQARACAKVLIG